MSGVARGGCIIWSSMGVAWITWTTATKFRTYKKSRLNCFTLTITIYRVEEAPASTYRGWLLAWLFADEEATMLVWWDVAFLSGIVNLPSGHAAQSYIRSFLSFVGTKIHQVLKILELVVLVSLKETKPVKKSWLKGILVGALRHSIWYSNTTTVWEAWSRLFFLHTLGVPRGFHFIDEGQRHFQNKKNLSRFGEKWQGLSASC